MPPYPQAESEETGLYATLLQTYLDDTGLVDYRGLKANREGLDLFASRLRDLDGTVYENWTDQHKIAFWLNAYNSLTLRLIIDHYPIKSSFIKSLRYPKNSIRQISGGWDRIAFPVMGRPLTLNQIEHNILRARFSEPRIHMALVCASRSCPKLRQDPYTAENLEAQLQDQTRAFLRSEDNFSINRQKGEVYLSSIFKWFKEDFQSTEGPSPKLTGQTQAMSAVLVFVSRHVSEELRRYLLEARYNVKFLPYDWSLNERPKNLP